MLIFPIWPVVFVCGLLQAFTFQSGRWNIVTVWIDSGNGNLSYIQSPQRSSASFLVMV